MRDHRSCVFEPAAELAKAAIAALSLGGEIGVGLRPSSIAEARGTGLIQVLPKAASMSVPVDHLTHSTAASTFFEPAAAQKPQE